MGYQSLSALQAAPVFQSLVAQGRVSEPVFSLYMSQSPDAELFLGGVNKKHYTGSITYVPVEQPVRI
jgi:cathepsin D